MFKKVALYLLFSTYVSCVGAQSVSGSGSGSSTDVPTSAPTEFNTILESASGSSTDVPTLTATEFYTTLESASDSSTDVPTKPVTSISVETGSVSESESFSASVSEMPSFSPSELQLLGPEGCLYVEASYSYASGEDPSGPYTVRECIILSSGEGVEIEGISDDEIKLNSGASGNTILKVDPPAPIRNGVMTIPEGATITTEKFGTRYLSQKKQRILQQTGTRRVFVIRAVAPDASTTSNIVDISNAVFGTDGDPFNLVSQYAACSFDQLRFRPLDGTLNGETIDAGVGEVFLTDDVVGRSEFAVRQAMLEAANTQYGNLQGLVDNGDINHVMLCLPPGTLFRNSRNWSGVGLINFWVSAYNDEWCNFPSAQMHCVGSNLNLDRSDDGGVPFGDQSCMMGEPVRIDNGPAMCFNAPKNWQLGWYPEGEESLAVLDGETYLGNLIGLSEFDRLDAGSNERVLIRITGYGLDFYVSFNRRSGINAGTREGGDLVLVHSRIPGTDSAISNLVATMGAGDVLEVGNRGRPTTIRVIRINTGATPGFALVQIGVIPSDSPSSDPSSRPSLMPSSSRRPSTNPSESPSSNPSISQMPSADPSSSPSSDPSRSPSDSPSVSNAPSQSMNPSRSPSDVPSISPTISQEPSLSHAPSIEPSDDPSSSPTISNAPSVSFAPSVSLNPSKQPSDPPSPSPTVSFEPSISFQPSISQNPTSDPTNSPSEKPSVSQEPTVSQKPTVSFKPSVSKSPSHFPTIDCNIPRRFRSLRSIPRLLQQQISCAPSLSIKPTVSNAPSVSFQPTTSQLPSESPTDHPTKSPVEPTAHPTSTSSMPPVSGISRKGSGQNNIFQKYISNRRRKMAEKNKYAFP